MAKIVAIAFISLVLICKTAHSTRGLPFKPSFISDQKYISKYSPLVSVHHGFNELPVKVTAEVTAGLASGGEQYIFTAFGSAQRDATTDVEHGGIVCLYNITHVTVYAPNSEKGAVFYGGEVQAFDGFVFPEFLERGTVIVKAWKDFDFPTPDFYEDWRTIDVNNDQTTFLELEHSVGGYPDLVVVQTKGDTHGWVSEASGAISSFNTRAPRTPAASVYFGGVMFGCSATHIRIWAPNQEMSNNTVTLFYVKNGWGEDGVTDIAETSGQIRVMAWKFDNVDKVFQKYITVTPFVFDSNIDITGIQALPYDNQLLLVQVESPSYISSNSGYRFSGIGSSMTNGQDGTFGGLIYGRQASNIYLRLPKPIGEDPSNAICIYEPWSTPSTKECTNIGGLEIRITIYLFYTIDDVKCTIDAEVNTFLNRTRSTLDTLDTTLLSSAKEIDFNQTLGLTCEAGLVHISGDDFMYCSRNGDIISDNPIHCGVPRCPIPRAMNNTGPPTFTNVTLGSTVTYTCLPGYTMENPADKTRTCQLNSAWSGSPPVCNPVECPPISSVLFASYQETGNVFRDNVTYQCDTGFPHLSGNLFRTCKADGTWSGIDPVCEYCDCPCDGSNVTSFKLNNATLEELLAALKAELQVDKKSTSMAVRRKISVYEDRPVAKGLGAMGVVLLVFVFAFVIIPDIPRLNTDIKMGYHNLFSCSGKKE